MISAMSLVLIENNIFIIYNQQISLGNIFNWEDCFYGKETLMEGNVNL